MNKQIVLKPYVHELSGDVVMTTPGRAVFLPGYKPVLFLKDKTGKPFMRMPFKHATVDIFENGEQKVVSDGNRNPK